MNPWTDLIDFLEQDGVYIVGVAAASFVYLSVDLFIVIKRFGSIIRTLSFWMFWFCTFVLNILAFEALKGIQDTSKDGKFGHAQMLALVVFSTLGDTDSLCKLCGEDKAKKVINLNRCLIVSGRLKRARTSREEPLRWIVSPCSELPTNSTRRTRIHRRGCATNSPRSPPYGGREASEAAAELSRIEDNAIALQVPSAKLLAQRIAQTDLREAQRLVWQAGLSKTSSP